MRVNSIGLGSGRFAQLIGRLGVDRIDREARFQQEGDQQAMVGFDNAGQVLGRSRDAEQKLLSTRSSPSGCGQSAATPTRLPASSSTSTS